MVAYDYARRGDTVNGVYTNQVAREFLPTVGRKPAWASWSPTDSIFGMYHLSSTPKVQSLTVRIVTWVGANDCRILYVSSFDTYARFLTLSFRYTNERAEITPIIANLFAAQDTLYRAGARNFLFIDVPPLYMSPIGKRIFSTGAGVEGLESHRDKHGGKRRQIRKLER